MNIHLTRALAHHRAPIMVVAALALAASMGAASGQDRQRSPTNQYSAGADPNLQAAHSRSDRARFDRSGTRGRQGLGASALRPEGPGNGSD
jgi:hypothetical protein